MQSGQQHEHATATSKAVQQELRKMALPLKQGSNWVCPEGAAQHVAGAGVLMAV
jgi:hypothetical protein